MAQRCYSVAMSLPFALPNWLPWWVPIAILVPALLYALVFLLMPFSVFGLRSRLDSVDMRLDEIQNEIRALVLRLPEARRRDAEETELLYPPLIDRPPIPPEPNRSPPFEQGSRSRLSVTTPPSRPQRDPRDVRAEPPRLDWPR